MANNTRTPLLNEIYQQYLVDQDSAALVRKISERYTIGTLERIMVDGPRISRRGAVLALGLVGDYSSNAVLGRAMIDEDRGVRTLAESGIRSLWCRAGNANQRRKLGIVIRMNSSHRFEDAVRRATDLIEEAPWLAETWNQRAIAYFSQGRFDDSIRDCQQTLELNPYHFGAASGMGQCYLHLNDRVGALECFRRALRLNPNLEGIRTHVLYLQRSLQGED
jgi:tetratricopeptide (TPR) repeat protein